MAEVRLCTDKRSRDRGGSRKVELGCAEEYTLMVATLTACDALACLMTVHTPAQRATQQALVKVLAAILVL